MELLMSRNNLALAVALLSLSPACGGGACPADDGDLTGLVGGEEWTFAQGSTSSFLSDADGFYTIMYDDTFETCDLFSAPTGSNLLMNIPTEPGEYPLSLSDNITFYIPPGDNLIAVSGTLMVDEVTETTISGSLCATYDDDNTVSGSFTVDICP
jgi:hypothetical protein